MKAVLCETFGPPESLVVADLPTPEPGPGEALVSVRASALNFFDTLIIADRYQVKPPLPFSPGAEFAGVIAALGPGTGESGFSVGDRVCGWIGWGACREMVTAPVSRLVRLPDSLDDVRAAGLSVTYGTALHGLRDRGEIKAGETLLVLGAAGGAGLAAVEIGALMGARVIAGASSPDKLALALANGAAEGIDYEREDLRARLKSLTDGQGVDVVYDTIGGPLSEAAFRSLAWRGRHLVVGFAAGDIPRLPFNLPLLKGADLRGVFWGGYVEREPLAHARDQADIVAWAAQGRLKATVGEVVPLAETARALRLIVDRKARGKIVVVP
jgi:NADPH2:quinone reductase